MSLQAAARLIVDEWADALMLNSQEIIATVVRVFEMNRPRQQTEGSVSGKAASNFNISNKATGGWVAIRRQPVVFTQKEAIMNSGRTFKKTIIMILGIFFIASAWAAAGSRTIVLEPTAKHPDASGSAVIDQQHVSIQARGLKPDSVYTVWFVNMKPNKHETGAGSSPYMFRSDQWGDGNYSAPLGEAPFGKWSMIMVVLHPAGDPKDMKNMIGALKAAL